MNLLDILNIVSDWTYCEGNEVKTDIGDLEKIVIIQSDSLRYLVKSAKIHNDCIILNIEEKEF